MAYITEIHVLTALTALDAGSLSPRCQQGQRLVRSAAYSLCPHMAFPPGVHTPGVSLTSCEDTRPIGSGPHPYDLISLYPLKGLIYKESHQGLVHHCGNFEGTQCNLTIDASKLCVPPGAAPTAWVHQASPRCQRLSARLGS